MFRISNHVSVRLKHHACNSLSNAYRAAKNDIAARGASPSQHESWHVAHLCKEIGSLASTWRAELAVAAPSTTLSMSSVFTHQSPYVKWKSSGASQKRCELADLLIAIIDRTGSDPKGHAALVQAKMSDNGSIDIATSSERKQFELLTKRPIFDVDKTGGPRQVDLQGYFPDSGLLYGLAASSPAPYIGLYCHPWWRETWLVEDELIRSSAAERITASDCLASTLVGLLQGSFGWQFNLPPSGENWQHFSSAQSRDSWSELINYLLEETFSKALAKAHSVAAARPLRGQEDMLCLTAGSPMGRMFFLTSMGDNSHMQNFRGGSEDVGIGWHRASHEELFNGGGFGGPDRVMDGDLPEGGPISAIVIEIARRD